MGHYKKRVQRTGKIFEASYIRDNEIWTVKDEGDDPANLQVIRTQTCAIVHCECATNVVCSGGLICSGDT